MTESEVYESLKAIFREVFKRDVDLAPSVDAAKVPGWDSFAHVSIIMECEEKFGIEFSTSEIYNFDTIGDFVAMILRKRAVALDKGPAVV